LTNTRFALKFIINADDWTAPGVDDSGQKRQSAWINNSTNICPIGFSLPTLEELRAEINGSRNRFSLVNSKLKLSLNGLRNKAGLITRCLDCWLLSKPFDADLAISLVQ
jgi:hypothetical protein